MDGVTEFWLIRHAPADVQGRLAGRRDVGLIRAAPAACGVAVDRVVTSPARRCRETAAGLFPQPAAAADARLWEQDFGDWDGLALAELPDLGPLTAAQLADHQPPGGESFAALCARVWPALDEAPSGHVAVVAHAGTVRAALALALGRRPEAGLAFQIAPLSLTCLTRTQAGWSIGLVNGPLP